jgi:hypothetical protein
MEALGLGCMDMVPGGSLVSADIMYAIKACGVQTINRGYINGNICGLSGNQAIIKVLEKYQISFKLVKDDHQSLVKLAEHDRIQLVLLPRGRETEDNEQAWTLNIHL